ncbi:hypothetical protein ACN28S_28555 [Cystobacter fuscus]
MPSLRPSFRRYLPLAASTLLAALILGTTTARAYTIETPVTEGCHERITAAALARAGWPDGALPPAPTAGQKVLVDNLPFHLPTARDAWTVAMLAGVRDNDLHGAAATDLPEHVEVDLAPASQPEHCLRTSDQDFAAGDVQAAQACHDSILEQVALALGDAEAIDLDATEPVQLALKYQRALVPLPRYAYRLGRALHALQDSFTHIYRSPDMRRIWSVFNYVDPALAPDYNPARDGRAHVSAFDRCTDEDAPGQARVAAATQASADLLAALADGSGGRQGRLARADAVLQGYLQVAPGCSIGNDWCGALESYATSPTHSEGCAAAPGVLSAGALLAGLGLLRQRRRRGGHRGRP